MSDNRMHVKLVTAILLGDILLVNLYECINGTHLQLVIHHCQEKTLPKELKMKFETHGVMFKELTDIVKFIHVKRYSM